MALKESPPFPRGATFYNGGTIDSNNLGGTNLEGTPWIFEDYDFSAAGVKPTRTNHLVECIAARNVSGFTALPKRLAKMQTSGGTTLLGRFDGYGSTTAEGPVFPIDEWLPSAGVVNNDLCWLVVSGPATVLTDLAAAAGNVISVGNFLVSLTAATSGATTAGRVAVQDLTGATALLGNQAQNAIGRALSAATTNNTNTGLLVNMGKW